MQLVKKVSVRRDKIAEIKKNYVHCECKKYKLKMQRTKKSDHPKKEKYATY